MRLRRLAGHCAFQRPPCIMSGRRSACWRPSATLLAPVSAAACCVRALAAERRRCSFVRRLCRCPGFWVDDIAGCVFCSAPAQLHRDRCCAFVVTLRLRVASLPGPASSSQCLQSARKVRHRLQRRLLVSCIALTLAAYFWNLWRLPPQARCLGHLVLAMSFLRAFCSSARMTMHILSQRCGHLCHWRIRWVCMLRSLVAALPEA